MKDKISANEVDSILEESEEVGQSRFDSFAITFSSPAVDSPLGKDSDLSIATFCDTCKLYNQHREAAFDSTWHHLKDNLHVVGSTVATLQIMQVPRAGG